MYEEKESVVDNPKPMVSKSLEGPSADVVIRLYGIVKKMEYADRIDFDAVNQVRKFPSCRFQCDVRLHAML